MFAPSCEVAGPDASGGPCVAGGADSDLLVLSPSIGEARGGECACGRDVSWARLSELCFGSRCCGGHGSRRSSSCEYMDGSVDACDVLASSPLDPVPEVPGCSELKVETSAGDADCPYFIAGDLLRPVIPLLVPFVKGLGATGGFPLASTGVPVVLEE